MRTTDRWKLLFVILLGVNLIGAAALGFLVIGDPPGAKGYVTGAGSEADGKLVVTATKRDLNRTMNHFLARYTSGTQMKYRVEIEEDIRLSGMLRVFEREVKMEMRFVPTVLANGDIMLQTNSMHIGALPLPVKKALGFIRSQYSLPEWVVIEPNEERVYVAITSMKAGGDLRARVVAFDPLADEFRFELYVPG